LLPASSRCLSEVKASKDNQHDITLTKSMQQMAEKSFAKIWDNEEDADYDNL
jgi:hypothetical protein